MRAGSLLILVLATACTTRPVTPPGRGSAPPAELAFGLSSRATTQQMLAHFGPSATLTGRQGKMPGCPNYDSQTISVVPFADGELSGSLRLFFANDRLHTVSFFPKQYAPYLELLRARGVPIDGYNSKLTVYVRSHPTDDLGSHVEWQDVAIAGEIREWIDRCVD
jgi:hypothetical protein